MSYTKGYRYGVVPGQDNKYAVPHKEIQNPDYAATLNIAPLSPDSEEIFVDVKQLTGAMTLTADVDVPFAGDKMRVALHADGTNRVVTLGTGFVTNSTVTVVANKEAMLQFVFSATSQKWVEVSRFVQS